MRENSIHIGHYHVLSLLKGGIVMVGSIHSNQRCSVCSSLFRDDGKSGLWCKLHQTQASRFIVRFGKVTRRFNNYSEALTFLSYLRVERSQGTFDHRKYMLASPLQFTLIAEQFMEIKGKLCKPSTLRKYNQYYTICSNHFGNVHIHLIDHKQLQLFIHSLDYSTYSVKCIIDWIMELLQWCYDNGDITRIPKRPKWNWKCEMKPIVDKDTQSAILARIYEDEWSRVPRACVGIELLCTYPKIRPGELRQVKEGDIDLKAGTILIRYPKEGKDNKIVHLIPEHIDLLRSLPRGFPGMYFLRYDYPLKGRKVGDRFGKDYLYYVWRRACKKLGIQGVDLYRGTKTSTITEWAKKYSLPLIKQASNVTAATERYIHLGEEDVQRLYCEAKPGKSLIKKGINNDS